MQIIKNLLWLDCTAGAIAGTLVILFSAWLSDLYYIPQKLLLFIGAVNLVYACYSFSLAIHAKRPVFLINILVMANGIWALVCLGIVGQSPGDMTLLGYIHIAGEAIFVGGLAISEWKWRNQLLITAYRLDRDRDREASHDLTRLLDEPGPDQNLLLPLKISFPVAPAAKGLGVTKPDGGDDSRHHCHGVPSK